ncbi:hypothetical protein [Polynucleobacter sp. MWH-Braz-FAM2G]|uniref:hypothetical protein n=1 Tax=Polynucleobacter sp. MWH-Braz-FAM2G TaxID=1855883 RepID=UPI001BFE3413|nr:hypothetical protein [Polynucleobacter sp. MWH-Braz-FAM2G]QWD91650.1 hypothetical protein FD973_04795 [Polynucleobacter sp. MWH-Braz-FAM2G]
MAPTNTLFPSLAMIASRREFISGLIASMGVTAILNLLPTSELLIKAAQENATQAEDLMNEITPIQKEIRRLMGIAACIQEQPGHIFTDEDLVALAVAAGCNFALVAEGSGTALKPVHEIAAKRLINNRINVYENGVFYASLSSHQLPSLPSSPHTS